MLDPPPDMAAAISVVGPHDMSRYFWETGAPSLDVLPWTDLLLNTGEGDLFSPFYRIMTVNKRMRHVYDAVPLLPAIEQYFEGRAPWLREQLTRHDLRDKYWDSMQYGSALDRATVPILVSSGWRDFFIVQALEQYARLSERGVNVALTIGPWIHHQVNAATHKDTFAWLEKHLADRTENRRPRGPVQVFVTGTGKDKDDQGVWCHLPKWPPATTPFEFYLLSAGKLATTASPAHTEPTSTSFTFDPASPTPAVAGPFSDGAISDEVLAARGDVVMFTSDPLENDLELLGAAAVELAHTSDNPHIDLYLRLSEVRDNKARIIADAYRRLDPKRDPTELVQLSLHPCAHHFRKGGQIRLLVAGGQHPKYMRNLGTDESPISGATMRKATHTIYYNVKKVSRVILPVGEITRKFGHIDL